MPADLQGAPAVDPPATLKAAAREYGDGGGLNPAAFADIQQCAKRLWKSTNALERALTKAVLPIGADLDF